jgi:hypothetical protein
MKKPFFTPPAAKQVVQPLPRRRRRFLFLALVTLFVCAVPVFVFYATGYRYNFFSPDASITATGGLYISVDNDAGEVFLNDEAVTDSRIFRKALYVQSLKPGIERVHVQAPGYQTWVKELPVYAHMVTEASAFLLPEVPQVRPITPFLTAAGLPVFMGVPTTTKTLFIGSSSIPVLATTTMATTSFVLNSEYLFVRSLFGTTTATTTTPLLDRVVDEAIDILQGTTAGTSTTPTSTATTTIIQNDTTLFERGGDIYVRYTGSERSIPYYFCIPADMEVASSTRYRAQVIEARLAYAEERGLSDMATTNTERLCRREIKIDRQGHEVLSFRFFPGSTDLVVLHRTDGIVVTEVDDRAWQNTQKLYPGTATAFTIEGGRLYVAAGDSLFELLTEVPNQP